MQQDVARSRAFTILLKSEQGTRLDLLLASALDDGQISIQDRRFITELVAGTTRMKGRLDAELAPLYKGRYAHIETGIVTLLRLGAYQLRFMDSVPDHAAINSTIELAKAKKLQRAAGLINGILRTLTRTPPLTEPASDSTSKSLAAFHSHPQWIVDRWLEQFGPERTISLLKWNNQRPTVWYRKSCPAENQQALATMLAETGFVVEDYPRLKDYLKVVEGGNLIGSPAWKAGLLSVQDPASGAAAAIVAARPGETIIDLCAGPGGKTAVLAEQVGSDGRILACEIVHEKANLINDTLQRLNLSNVEIFPGDAMRQKLPKADRVLVDAPCTGTGVMSKRADLRWRREPVNLDEMVELQNTLLEFAATRVKKGGSLIYSTCSLEREENWDRVEYFLENHPKFKLVRAGKRVPLNWQDERGALNIFPPEHSIDGFFAVRLRNK